MQRGGFLFLAVVVVLGPYAEGQPTANAEQACGPYWGATDVQGSSGNISSPGYPGPYPSNADCAWRIMVEEGKRIVIVFKALDIEHHGACSYDYLQIHDEAYMTAASLAKVCGNTLPPSVTSSGNNVLLIFRSDRSVGGVGFDIEWSAECLPGLISCGDICIGQSKKCNLTKDCIDWEDESEECLEQGLGANASLKNAELRGDLHCNSTSMSVTFSRDELSGPNVTSLRLRDPSCTAVLNNTHVTFSTALDECGTSFYKSVRWTFSCHYVRDDTVSTGPLFPVPAPSVIVINGEGTFTFRMELYRTDGFLQPYSQGEFPVEVGVNDQVYFGITAEASISGLVLFVENCRATPTSNKEDPTQYYIIQDGCETDDTLREYPSEESASARFGFSAFKFNNNPQPYVYLHCDVMVCLENNGGSRCDQGCVGARRRRRETAGAGIEGRTSLVQGPIVLVQDSDTNGALNIWIAVVASVAVGLAVVVMATAGCLWLCKRQKPRKDVEGHSNFVCTLKRGGKVGPVNSAPY
ncbi:CUZD1 [Branchiostoma lanceolatum]|uniref:CUZD1 protein n=1 Tax=Branchiostoma lanceolatum TaxID=7740 RepID=A0A8K0A3G0_BRALA|nr:CUZD1 [Branchiostoma lanceolatum]